jgi:hypothetical protein
MRQRDVRSCQVGAVVEMFMLLTAAVGAKRACSSSLPCDTTCVEASAKRHCRYCKCKSCLMCQPIASRLAGASAPTGKRSQQADVLQQTLQQGQEERPQLGRARRWIPATAETPHMHNRSAASSVLRVLGYVPASQLPLEFGGPDTEFSLAGTRFGALAQAEVAAAGPKLLPLRDQRQQVAAGERKPADVSWHDSPVAGLLPQSKARPPTPKSRARHHKLQLLSKSKRKAPPSTQLSGRTATHVWLREANLTLKLPSASGTVPTGSNNRHRKRLPRHRTSSAVLRQGSTAIGAQNLTLILPSHNSKGKASSLPSSAPLSPQTAELAPIIP